MPEYRIFRLDNSGKIVQRSEKIKFENDQDAIHDARKTLNGATIEIWDGPRRVATIRPKDIGEPRV